MKSAALLACTIPELRRMTLGQLFKVWGACTPYPRHVIYLHLILLMACASVIFNTAMRLSDSFFLDMIGLAIGLLVPPNIYFHHIFKNRLADLRQYIQDNWDEFKPE